MKLIRSMLPTALCLAYASALQAAEGPKKNWTPPAEKIHAQTLADEIISKHAELISVTFHGVPPELDDVYTMFACSFPYCISNQDAHDHVDLISQGITIVD